MAPTKRLAQLALLTAIATDMAVATAGQRDAQRKLRDDATVFPVSAGEEYVVEFSDESDTEVVVMTESQNVPEETTVFVEDGEITSIAIGTETYTVSYVYHEDGEVDDVTLVSGDAATRRTQQVGLVDRRLLSCEQSCQASANKLCGALQFGCSDGSLATLLGPMCDDLDDLCNLAGILFGCERTCAPSCATDDDCTKPNEICCPSMMICEVPDITGACRDPTPPPTPGTPAPTTPAPTTPAPTTPAPTTPAPTTPTPTMPGCNDERIGDIYCDHENNNERCSYDGGDCCNCYCVEFPIDGYCRFHGLGFDCIDPSSPCSQGVTPAPTTPAPTTLAPTTLAPTTPAPTTLAPTTPAPTTPAPTTPAPTTLAPTTPVPTTPAPTTPAPTTPAPATPTPTTPPPTTTAPTTPAPTTPAPTTPAPATAAPTTGTPTTPAPTMPDTPAPTPAPVTDDEDVCMAGVPGILFKEVCCPSSCGSCAGKGCSDRDGGDDFTGHEACCKSGVEDLGRVCSATVGAPCIVSDDTPAPTPAPVTDDEDVCMAGVPGILFKEVCCPSSCGSCAGKGCSDRDGGDDFTGHEACCKSGVEDLGRVCSATVGAPCIVSDDTPAPTPAPVTDDEDVCMAGVPGILFKEVCCPSSCGSCAGKGCSDRDGGDDFTGHEACCKSGVEDLGRVCSATVGAPCIVSDDTPAPTPAPVTDDEDVCMAGVPGILFKEVCCPSSCGSCAGKGCSDRDGGDDFTGHEACCKSGVEDLGRVCSATVGAPCIVSDEPKPPAPTPAPVTDGEVCIVGVPGILVKDVCCPRSCGSCAGAGCSGRDGGDDFTGSQACCGSGVRSLGRICSAEVGAPCVVEEEDTEEFSCSGDAGILQGNVCCEASCGTCGGSGCSGRGNGQFSCCTRNIKDVGEMCSEKKSAPCIVD
eukprot:g11859.t1